MSSSRQGKAPKGRVTVSEIYSDVEVNQISIDTPEQAAASDSQPAAKAKAKAKATGKSSWVNWSAINASYECIGLWIVNAELPANIKTELNEQCMAHYAALNDEFGPAPEDIAPHTQMQDYFVIGGIGDLIMTLIAFEDYPDHRRRELVNRVFDSARSGSVHLHWMHRVLMTEIINAQAGDALPGSMHTQILNLIEQKPMEQHPGLLNQLRNALTGDFGEPSHRMGDMITELGTTTSATPQAKAKAKAKAVAQEIDPPGYYLPRLEDFYWGTGPGPRPGA